MKTVIALMTSVLSCWVSRGPLVAHYFHELGNVANVQERTQEKSMKVSEIKEGKRTI